MWKSEGNAVVKKVLEAQLARQEFAHAYLFLGEGVNTYALALAFAHKIRGKQSGNNDSDIFTLSVSEDFGVAETRELINRLSVRPLSGKHKVGIVDNAHMLNTQSANALLKTIEEPSSSTIIMLVARNRSLPSTILSRCQIFTCYWPTAPSTTNAEEVKNYIAEFNEIPLNAIASQMGGKLLFFLAIVVFTEASHLEEGCESFFTVISTMSPFFNCENRGDIFPLTLAANAWSPMSECMEYAKSKGVDASGKSITSPFGVNTKIRSLKKSILRWERKLSG